MSGQTHILWSKSWHPGTPANIEKITRDKAKAREANEAAELHESSVLAAMLKTLPTELTSTIDCKQGAVRACRYNGMCS